MTHSSPLPPVVVIGSGAAGLSAALSLAPLPVMVLSKTASLTAGSTPWAQGGIAAALAEADQPALHAADTVSAGAGLTDGSIAALLAHEGPRAIARLLAQGMPFDRTSDGRLALAREAAHGQARVIHAGGDSTGRHVAATLLAEVASTPSITCCSDSLAVDLILDPHGNNLRGVLILDPTGWRIQPASAVVLASGGMGMAWRETTNPPENTGDGLAMAARARALLADLEFMQFHPTALAVADSDGSRLPLLTEALRGSGAVLLDRDGVAFMAAEHPLADLAPRDVVARAVGKRAAAGQPVFLDLRPALARDGADHFPQVLESCRAHGFDPFTTPVPVVPAAHYHMGGVVTDHRGRTSLSGLWACGEVACTGVHGANRLASNSLLEALVFGDRVAADITLAAADGRLNREMAIAAVSIPAVRDGAGCRALRDALRVLCSRALGLVRDGDGLRAAIDEVARLDQQFSALPRVAPSLADGQAWVEARSLLTLVPLLLASAEHRQESRGAHCRLDHPQPREAFCHRLTVRQGRTPRSAEILPLHGLAGEPSNPAPASTLFPLQSVPRSPA